MRVHRHPAAVDLSVRELQDPVGSLGRAGRRWSRRARLLARLRGPWLDRALLAGTDPAASPALECRAAHHLSRDRRAALVAALRRSRESTRVPDRRDVRVPVDPEEVRLALDRLIELEDLLLRPGPVYCQGVVMASRIVTDGTGPLYAPARRGELRERVGAVLAALRGAL